MSHALQVPDVEARLMRQLVTDRKHATTRVERAGFDVAYGMAIWLAARTGEDVMGIVHRLGAEVDQLLAVMWL